MNTIYHMYEGKFINSKEIFGESSKYNTNFFINFADHFNIISIICDNACVDVLTKKLNEKYGLTISNDSYMYYIKSVYGNLCFYHLELNPDDKNKLFEHLKNIQTTYIINGEKYNKKTVNIIDKRSYYECSSYIEHVFDKKYKLISPDEISNSITNNSYNICFLKDVELSHFNFTYYQKIF